MHNKTGPFRFGHKIEINLQSMIKLAPFGFTYQTTNLEEKNAQNICSFHHHQ